MNCVPHLLIYVFCFLIGVSIFTVKSHLCCISHTCRAVLQRLSWDGFWRFTRDLDLGLDDAAIAELRQKADVNRDGYVDWGEMVDVFAPILVTIYKSAA